MKYSPAILACLTIALLLVAATAAARTWHVPDEIPTIAAALDSAVAGDVVELAAGTYLEHDLPLKAAVTLRGESGLAADVVIDAQQQGRVLVAEDLHQAAILDGLTVTGGVAPIDEHYGGGIYCLESALTIERCVIRDNYTTYSGGGLYVHRGTVMITDTVFTGNTAENGSGGAADFYQVEGELRDCLFAGNTATDAAGIDLSRSSPLIDHCTFLSNEGRFFGGAIFCVTESMPVFSHCTMADNVAVLGGGMMVADRSHPVLDACIIAFNREGSGIDVHDLGSTVTITCSDVHGNEAGGYSGYLEDQTGLDGNIDVDPAFCDLATGDLTLADASPCLPAHNECELLMGAHDVGCVITAVPEAGLAALRLAPNRPNPFNPATTITFELPAPADVTLAVHDLAGRRVAFLCRGRLPAGRHDATWRGQDDHGRAVPSGTYLYRLEADGNEEVRTMTLIR